MFAENRHTTHYRMRLTGVIIMLAALQSILGGCSVSSVPRATFTATSLAEDPASLAIVLGEGCYAAQPAETSFYLSNRTLEELTSGDVRDGIILHAQLLWKPKPGSTPVDPTATNVVLRMVLITQGQLGIYGGAGFAWPNGTAGKSAMSLEVVGSTLTLLQSTEGFRDLLSPFVMIGTLQAPLKPVETLRFRQASSQLVTDRLGKTQWVQSHPDRPEPISSTQAMSTLAISID